MDQTGKKSLEFVILISFKAIETLRKYYLEKFKISGFKMLNDLIFMSRIGSPEI